MQTNNILSASLIDIIFDGHNKDYGAYELRTNYSKRINKALLITMAVAALAIGGATLANSSKKNRGSDRMGPVVTLADIPPDKKLEPLPKPEKQPKVEQVKTKIYTPPEIIRDEDVVTPPPTQAELVDSKIGTEKFDGVNDDGIAKPENIDGGKGIVEQKPQKEPDEPYTTVEIDAKCNCNWKAFLERNLNANVPVDNGAPVGRYSVVVQFVVDKEGNVSDIQTLTHHGYGLEDEAIRVLRKAIKWEPAIQNGFKVKAYKKQVIIFEVNEEG
jgi:periplasmic protein TonB